MEILQHLRKLTDKSYKIFGKYAPDIFSDIPTAILLFIVSGIIGFDTKEGMTILGIALAIPLLKLGMVIPIEKRYGTLERKIDNVVNNLSKKAYVLKHSNLLAYFSPLLLRQYFEQELKDLQEKIIRSDSGEAITDIATIELYKLIRFMTENETNKIIYSVDLSIKRWTGIFEKKDYIKIGCSEEEAERRVRDNFESYWLNDTTILFNKNKNRITKPSDDLTIKRIFKFSDEDIKNNENIMILTIMNELEKVSKGKLQTKILIEKNLKVDGREAFNYLNDIVIFNEDIAFIENIGSDIGHSIIIRPEDVTKYTEYFLELWDQKSGILSVSNFLEKFPLKNEDKVNDNGT